MPSFDTFIASLRSEFGERCAVCKSNIFECRTGDTCDTDCNLTVGYKRG